MDLDRLSASLDQKNNEIATAVQSISDSLLNFFLPESSGTYIFYIEPDIKISLFVQEFADLSDSLLICAVIISKYCQIHRFV